MTWLLGSRGEHIPGPAAVKQSHRAKAHQARLGPVARAEFSPKAVPAFDEAPSIVLVAGEVAFFVEEAAGRAREALSQGEVEVLRFDETSPVEAAADALLNRSLFSPRRLVEVDATPLLGEESPSELLEKAVEAWEAGTPAKRRIAFRATQALLSSVEIAPGKAEDTAEAVGKRLRRKGDVETLTEILRDLPEERAGGGGDALKAALRTLLERENDGTVVLLRAVKPPKGVGLVDEIARKGLVLEVGVGESREERIPALQRLAAARSKEREVSVEPAAIERLLTRTDADPPIFSAELEKLLDWAGKGGRVRASDVEANVEDEASEDLYAFYDAIGRRNAGEVLSHLERILSGRAVRVGEREVDTEEYWPVRFLGMLTTEIRRMLFVRSRLEEAKIGFDANMSYPTFQARVLPHLVTPVVPFGRPAVQGKPYGIYKLAERAARFKSDELARALGRAAAVDTELKASRPPLEALSVYVGQLVAGS